MVTSVVCDLSPEACDRRESCEARLKSQLKQVDFSC